MKSEELIGFLKKIGIFILSIYSYIVICVSFGLIKTDLQYNFFSIIILGFVMYVFYNAKITNDRRDKKYLIILSLLLSIVLIIGKSVYSNINISNTLSNIYSIKSFLIDLVYIIGLFPFFFILFNKIFEKYKKINILKNNNKKFKCVFLLSWLLIFLSYIPYFLRCYPAMMSPDSFVQINTVEQKILTDLHPFVQTWFFGGIYNLGKIIFGLGNKAIAFYIIIQMLIVSLLFALEILFLYKNKVNKFICSIVLCFICINPLYAYYSVTLWKDILFGSNFIILFISLFYLIKDEKKINFKNKYLYMLIISITILMFFRNNGIYVFILMIPFLIFYFKNNRKLFSAVSVILLIFYFIIKGPIFSLLGVSETRTVESYSIPLQQIARTIVLNGDITESEYEKLSKHLDIKSVKENYVSYISDPVKNSVNTEYFNENITEFLNLWVKIMIKNPRIFIDSYMSSTLGYWYPNVIYHAISYVSCANELYNAYEYDIDNDPKGLKIINKIIDYTNARTYPLANLFWSVGLNCLIMFLGFIFINYNKKTKKYAICYIPFICLWLTMMIATPVFAELRYVYGIFTCIPLIILLPFITKNQKSR